MKTVSIAISPAFTRVLRWAAAAFAVANLVACASVQLPAPTASADNVRAIRDAKVAPANVGTFGLAAGKSPDMNTTLGGLRGSSVTPAGGSFSQQLKDELIAAMKGAGMYDDKSSTVIEGRLTDSKVDAAIGTGTARLAAQISVTRAGKKEFDKEVAVESSWESSFIGAVALPLAINQYNALYKALITKLFGDADFRKAAAP